MGSNQRVDFSVPEGTNRFWHLAAMGPNLKRRAARADLRYSLFKWEAEKWIWSFNV